MALRQEVGRLDALLPARAIENLASIGVIAIGYDGKPRFSNNGLPAGL